MRGNQCGTQYTSLMHSIDCRNVDAAGACTLDGNCCVHQVAATVLENSTDLVDESPLQRYI